MELEIFLKYSCNLHLFNKRHVNILLIIYWEYINESVVEKRQMWEDVNDVANDREDS